MSYLMFVTGWVLLLLPFISVAAESKCRSELISSIYVTTELQSDVLLPCIFEPTLLGSDMTADVAAVWSRRDGTVDNLLEIKLQGVVMFWNIKSVQVKTFPKLSESGNFSILLRNAQRSDLGLYRCELHEGLTCLIAYQEIHLKHVTPAWLITAAAIGGGTVLLVLLIISCAKRDALDYSVYTSVTYTMLDDQCRDGV